MVRLADEADVAEPQVAQPAVDQLRRRARRRACEVALVDERDGETVRRRGLRDAGADDPAADHEQVELARRELLERRYAFVHSGFVQAFRPWGSQTSMRPNGASGGFSSLHAVIRPAESRSRMVDAFG